MKQKIGIIFIIGVIALMGNWVGYGTPPQDALAGMLVVIAVTVAGLAITTYLPLKLPAVVWISLLALLVTSPIFPGHDQLNQATGKLEFMALATPILAYAGLSFGKDIQEFKKLGWRIVVISLVVYTGTFLLATIFAEITFKLTGKFH